MKKEGKSDFNDKVRASSQDCREAHVLATRNQTDGNRPGGIDC